MEIILQRVASRSISIRHLTVWLKVETLISHGLHTAFFYSFRFVSHGFSHWCLNVVKKNKGFLSKGVWPINGQFDGRLSRFNSDLMKDHSAAILNCVIDQVLDCWIFKMTTFKHIKNGKLMGKPNRLFSSYKF